MFLPDTRDDSHLLQHYATAQSGDAFAELVRRYVGLVYHAALRQLGDERHAAEDVTQQVFIRLAARARHLQGHPSLAGWLHVTTRRVVHEVLRSERRRQVREQAAALMHELIPNQPSADWSRLRPLLDQAVGELPAPDREAVLLRFFTNLSLAEVGTQLGVSENTARMRIQRALDRLQGVLTRHGVASTAGAVGLILASHANGAVPPGLALTVTNASLAATVATGSTTMAAGLIAFMSTSKWLGVCLAALIGVGVLHRFERHSRQQAEELLRGARLEERVHASRLAEARTRLAVARETPPDNERTSSASAAPTAARAGAASTRAAMPVETPWDPMREGREFLTQNPVIKEALHEYIRASLRWQFGALYRELGLTPEQIAQFEQIRGHGHTMGARTPEGKTVSLPFDGGAKGNVQDVLGPAGMSRYREYSLTVPARRAAAEVASALYFTDTPLTPAQADQLIDIIVANRSNKTGPAPAEFDWDAIMAKSAAMLAPRQLEVVAGRRAGDQFRQILNRPRPGNPKK